MPDFDAATFLDVAEELMTAEDPPPESYIRAAAGRAYYSQYGWLRHKITTTCGDCFGTKGKHQPLYSKCIASPDNMVRRIGKRLEFLCLLRNRADYKWAAADSPAFAEVETAISVATKLQQKMQRLSNQNILDIHAGL
jgi:hypothetical protein